jgi:hypothetical protein
MRTPIADASSASAPERSPDGDDRIVELHAVERNLLATVKWLLKSGGGGYCDDPGACAFFRDR